MNIDQNQIDELLGTPKKVELNGNLVDVVNINGDFPLSKRLTLISEQNSEISFIWEINQSSKNSLRLSLHHQEDEFKTGLLRVDYNGTHRNPAEITMDVPEIFQPFVGVQINESHIHYAIEGYRSLAWAIPLTNDKFPIKTITDENKDDNFANAIKEFAKTINLQTTIDLTYNRTLL